MQATDVDRMDTVYRRKINQTHTTRVVILSTGLWVPKTDPSSSPGSPTGYRMVVSRAAAGVLRRQAGWLCLEADPAQDTGDHTAAQMITAAPAALAAVKAGTTPMLPTGLRVVLVEARQITGTWADYEANRQRSLTAHADAQARLAEQQAADTAAHERITRLVGAPALTDITRRLDTTTTGAWTALETLLDTYHQALTEREDGLSHR